MQYDNQPLTQNPHLPTSDFEQLIAQLREEPQSMKDSVLIDLLVKLLGEPIDGKTIVLDGNLWVISSKEHEADLRKSKSSSGIYPAFL